MDVDIECPSTIPIDTQNQDTQNQDKEIDTNIIYALYRNDNSVGFVKNIKEANKWLKNIIKDTNFVDPDYEFKIETSRTSVVIYKKYKWYSISHFHTDNIYYFKELPVYIN